MSYCNVYRLTFKMFVGCGVPLEEIDFSKDKKAALHPNVWNEFIKFREASQIMEDFVFKVKNQKIITDFDDINTSVTLWSSIGDEMIEFMKTVSILSNSIDQRMSDLNVSQNDITTADPAVMMSLYVDIFDQMVHLVSKSSMIYQRAFNLLKKYNLETKDEQVSKSIILRMLNKLFDLFSVSLYIVVI